MMTKNVLFAVALMSLALCAGCATGGGGHTGAQIQVSVNTDPQNQTFLGVTLPLQFKATVTGTDNHAVTWSVSGASCTGNACGTIDANGLYTAPPAAPAKGLSVIVTATLQSDTTKSGTFALTVLPLTVTVTPKLSNGDPVSIAKGVTQQFSAIVNPDAEPQTVTWALTCDAGGNACGAIDPSTGLFTANPGAPPSPPTGHITATSTLDPTVLDTVNITIVKSRLVGSTTYAFRLSGFDASGPIAVAGNFTTNADGTAITGGIEDDLTINQPSNPTINSGSLSLDTNDHGSLTLNTSAGTRAYKVVLNADGDGRMIEFDGTGRRGSGEIAQATAKFKNSVLPAGSSFAFGLTGVITTGTQRAGFAGVFKSDGAGNISSGMLDKNENGTSRSVSDITGTYNIDDTSHPHPGRGTLTLTSNNLGKTYSYAIYVVAGQTNKATSPLTLFIISTDDPQTNPAVSGTIVFQDPTPTYVNSDFTDFWVSNLTGVDNAGHTLVSLTNANGDGAGHLGGIYVANNAGAIVTAKTISNYNYATAGSGRYTLDLLGDPAASPAVPPVHFVLYSSAASRGFLLSIDPSNPTVYTGSMDLQPGFNFAFAELAGSFAAATGSSGASGVSQIAANLLFTSVLPDFTVAGARDETDGGQNAGQSLAGTYTVDNFDGSGAITLTQPAENYVIYVLDNPKQSANMIQHFVMINVDPANTNPSVIFAER